MKGFTGLEKSKSFQQKSKSLKDLIRHMLHILEHFGVPINQTPRRLERMALVCLALADIRQLDHFSHAKDLDTPYALKTRDIIAYLNEHFEENISRGSYDDIRRKDLRFPITAGLIMTSLPSSATNDSTRGYGWNSIYSALLRSYPSDQWKSDTEKILKNLPQLVETLSRKRDLELIPVQLHNDDVLSFSPGAHNQLQKAIIEEFLPRYGKGAQVLYVGDAKDKFLYLNEDTLHRLQFFEIAHDKLPDVIAYTPSNNWLYLIEAVHSSGPIDEVRLLEFQQLTADCTADLVYVTAFLDRITFKKFAATIAWETEVWIADNPDHLIHYNGDKFLGPYSN